MKIQYKREVDISKLSSYECINLLQSVWGNGYYFDYSLIDDASDDGKIITIHRIHNHKASLVAYKYRGLEDSTETVEILRKLTYILIMQKVNNPKPTKKVKKPKKEKK